MVEYLTTYGSIAAAVAVVIGALWMTKFTPALKGLRVVVVNAAFGLFVALPEILSYFISVDWTEYLPEDRARWVILGLTALNIYMRVAWTTTPVGKSTLDSTP